MFQEVEIMKKIISFAVVLMVVVGMLSGCESASNTKISSLVVDGDWIYFTDSNDNGLYRMDVEMMEKNRIANGADNIIVQNDVIYYVDEQGSIAKMNSDGTGNSLIVDLGGNNLMTFTVAGEWVYYVEKPGAIYRIKADGTAKSKVTQLDFFKGGLEADDQGIYVEANGDLYKISFDGAVETEMAQNGELLDVNDGWIYYADATQQSETRDIYKIRTDGTGTVKICSGVFYAIVDLKLYYFDADEWLVQSNLDGSEPKQLNNISMFSPRGITSNYVFFIEYSGAAYRMNLDGSDKTRVQ